MFGSECKRGKAADNNSILVRWNQRTVIMHSYADVIEMKRANVRSYAFVCRHIEMKRMSVNLPLVVIFALVREELKAV